MFLKTLKMILWAIFLPFIGACVLEDILNHKNIRNAVIFNCHNIDYEISAQKTFINNEIKINYLKFDFNNITDVAILKSHSKIGVILNTSCNGWTNVIQNSDLHLTFKSHYNWFIITDELLATIDVLSRYPIEVDSDVIILYNNFSKVDIFEAYNTGFYTKGAFNVKLVGHWDANDKLVIKESNRMNMTGVVLKCMVVITKGITNETLEKYLKNSKATPFDALHKLKFFILLKYLRDMFKFSKVDIFEAYNTGFYTKGAFNVKLVGHWDANDKLVIKESNRMNMTGVVLKCMVVITKRITNETFEVYLKTSKPTAFDAMHKFKFFILLKYLRDMYNFGYVLQRTKSWGYLTDGHNFDGMIGALQRKEIDVGGSPILFRSERFKVIDYSIETWRSKQCFMFRHPKRLTAFYTIFTRPLSTTVWICLAILSALLTLTLFLLLQLRILEQPGDEQESSISIAFLTVWSAICQQGVTVQRGSISLRVVVFSTFIFTLTVYQYYNATVVATLLKVPPKNIRTLEDLLKSDMKAGVENVLYNVDFFKHTSNPTALKLYTDKLVKKTHTNFLKDDEGMGLVKKGGFAFHVDSAGGYNIMRHTFTEQEICDIQEIELFPPQNMVSVLKKGSPYRNLFAYGLRKMFESGLAQRIRSTWDEPKLNCIRTPDTSIFSVSISEFSTPLIILAVGMFMSVFILLFEIGLYRMYGRNNVVKFLN